MMKITVNAKTLKKAIGVAGVCVSKLSTMAELTKVHLTVLGDNLVAYGTDGNCAVTTVIEGATVDGNGICTIDGGLVSNVLSSVSDDKDVVLEMSDDKTVLTSGSLKLDIPVYESNIKPEATPDGDCSPIDVDMLAAVAHACALPDSNQAMAENVCVKFGESGKIAMASTDSNRIAVRGAYNADDKEILIPAESARKIHKLFAASDLVRIHATDTKVWVVDNNTVFSSSLSNGIYYKIQQLIDVKFEKENSIVISRKEWLASLKPYTSIQKRCVVLTADKKSVVLSATSSEIKTSLCNAFPVEKNSISKAVKFGFNPDFMVQALESIDDDSVTLRMSDTGVAPFYFEGDGYKEIILPVKI